MRGADILLEGSVDVSQHEGNGFGPLKHLLHPPGSRCYFEEEHPTLNTVRIQHPIWKKSQLYHVIKIRNNNL